MAAGDYVPTVWQNGEGVGHPPINAANLNNIEAKLLELDTLLINAENYRFDSLKRYFWARNCKEIHMFDDENDWAAINASTSLGEASDPDTGNEDVNFYDNDNVAGDIGMDDTIASIDLTKFNDEESSTTDDVICLNVSILNYTAFTAGLTLKIGEDNGNYYSYTFAMTESGRVTFQAKKSAFGQTGVPAGGWGAITYVALETTTAANKLGFTITGLSLMMYRNDPDNDGYGNPFQIYDGSAWSSFFEQNTDMWNLHFDPNLNDLCIQLLNDSNDTDEYDGLKVRSNIINFVWKSIMHCRYDDYSSIMTWYIDSDNYACAWIDDDDFTLLVNEAGVPHSETFTLNTSLDYGERLEIKLEKNSDTLRATLEKGNEIVKVLEYETSIDAVTQGDLYFGYDDVGLSMIPDFMISNVNNMNLDSWDRPKIIYKQYDEIVNNTAVLQNDDDLYAYLPPNSFLQISVFLYVDADSDTPDFKCAYVSTGCTVLTRRVGFGMGVSSTSGYDSETLNPAAEQETVEKDYGVDQIGLASIIEHFLVKTGTSGGTIRLQWAQNAAHASDTTLREGSWMKIEKVDLGQRIR
jgi:uncharacterized protein YheU (UPF0270 family)